MAQRLSCNERIRIEAVTTAGVSAAETARRLGRDPSTVHREIKRNSTPAGYGAARPRPRPTPGPAGPRHLCS